MNFFQFLVDQNSNLEAERYLTGSLHTQLEEWNTAITLFWVQVFITDLPQFQSQSQMVFKKNGATEPVVVKKARTSGINWYVLGQQSWLRVMTWR